MGLEVLVRDKTITISIKLSKDLEGAWFALAEGCVLDPGQQTTEPASSCLISDIARIFHVGKLLVHKAWRRVRSLLLADCQYQFIRIFLKDKRSDR